MRPYLIRKTLRCIVMKAREGVGVGKKEEGAAEEKPTPGKSPSCSGELREGSRREQRINWSRLQSNTAHK